MASLSNHRVAILATDGFEELTLTEPLRALRMAGARVDVISPKPSELGNEAIQAFHGDYETIRIQVDRELRDTVMADQYDSLVIPGGVRSVAMLQMYPEAIRFVRDMDEAEKPIAAICHAPEILLAAGLVDGRRLTSYPDIASELVAGGALWVDAESVLYDNWVTSRSPDDMPAFNRDIIELFSQRQPLISPETRHMFSRARIA
jgi:protease I